jgi:hypothetical protein
MPGRPLQASQDIGNDAVDCLCAIPIAGDSSGGGAGEDARVFKESPARAGTKRCAARVCRDHPDRVLRELGEELGGGIGADADYKCVRAYGHQ